MSGLVQELRTPDKAFFKDIPSFWANWADRTNDFWGIFGTANPLSIISFIQLFLSQKTLLFIPNPYNTIMILAEKNLGNSHHTSVVGAKLIRILAAIYNLLDGPYVKHISLTTLHSLHTQIIALMALNGTVGNLILRNQTQLWTCIKNSTLFRPSKKDYLNHIGMFMQVDFTNEFTLKYSQT